MLSGHSVRSGVYERAKVELGQAGAVSWQFGQGWETEYEIEENQEEIAKKICSR
jgi:hypothetical protein